MTKFKNIIFLGIILSLGLLNNVHAEEKYNGKSRVILSGKVANGK